MTLSTRRRRTEWKRRGEVKKRKRSMATLRRCRPQLRRCMRARMRIMTWRPSQLCLPTRHLIRFSARSRSTSLFVSYLYLQTTFETILTFHSPSCMGRLLLTTQRKHILSRFNTTSCRLQCLKHAHELDPHLVPDPPGTGPNILWRLC